jgi:hypothetical protein
VLRALIGGIAFAALVASYGVASPFTLAIGAAAFALVVAIVVHRQKTGQPVLPRGASIAVATAMLVMYGWAFLIKERPSGAGWVAVFLLVLLPVALLFEAANRRA